MLNNNTVLVPILKAENYLSPTVKKLLEKDVIGASSSSHNNKFYDRKLDDIGRFDFDETSNNVNNLIMTNFPPEKNYSLFQDNENSILYKNHNSNLLINDIFNSNFSQINPYMRNNNVSLYNNIQNNNTNSILKTPSKEMIDSKLDLIK